MLLEISQNSQENTCTRVSFLIKLQTLGAFLTGVSPLVFSCGFCEISKYTFSHRTPTVAASECLPTLGIQIGAVVEINKEVRCAVKCKIWPQHANFLYTKMPLQKKRVFFWQACQQNIVFFIVLLDVYMLQICFPKNFCFQAILTLSNGISKHLAAVNKTFFWEDVEVFAKSLLQFM